MKQVFQKTPRRWPTARLVVWTLAAVVVAVLLLRLKAEDLSTLVNWLTSISLEPVLALVAALYSAYWVARTWRYQYMAKQWHELVRFLFNHLDCMNPEINQEYHKHFSGTDAKRYELVARMCLSYLDDVYYLGLGRLTDAWLVGSLDLLGGTHRKWFDDHQDSYGPEFRAFLAGKLGVAVRPSSGAA